MSGYRIVGRVARRGITHFLLAGRYQPFQPHIHTNLLVHSNCCPVSESFNNLSIGKTRIFGLKFLSSSSPQPTGKESGQAVEEVLNSDDMNNTTSKNTPQTVEKADANKENKDTGVPQRQSESMENASQGNARSQSSRRRRSSAKTAAVSHSDGDEELSVDELVRLVTEKEELLKAKHKEVEKMQDKVLRSYAEMENVIDRTKREAESTKKYAIQNFAKSLLDVADNLARASFVGKGSLSKMDPSCSSEAIFRLKELLAGVEMTEKQLAEVFRKFGLEKYDPLGEPFDPNKHNAIAQVSDPSKDPGTIANVLKAGYMLHERIIRHAEVLVVAQSEAVNEEADQSMNT